MEFNAHDYQKHAMNHIRKFKKCGLFLDMGLGKTVTALTVLEQLLFDEFEIESGSILVIAPLRVAQSTWSEEIDKWSHLNRLTVSKILGSQKKRLAALEKKADFYTINRENVPWLVEHFKTKWPFKTLVIDELSSFKNPSSKRFRALKKITPLLDRVIGLTGTPSPRGLLDLWSQVYLLDRGERLGSTFTKFRDTYFKPGRRNGHVVYEYILKEGAEKEIQNKIADICLSLKAKDWLKLPDKIEVNHYTSLTDKELSLYKSFERSKVLEIEENPILANNGGVLFGKLLQFANGALYQEDKHYKILHDHKLDILEELVEGANGKPVLVFYNFKHDKDRIFERLKSYKPKTLESEEDKRLWDTGQIQVLVCHPASMGHGLNLQHGGNVVIWFGVTTDLEVYQQANARLYRQGQKQSVFIHHIITRATVDEDILPRLQAKDLTQQNLLEAVKARIKHEEARKK